MRRRLKQRAQPHLFKESYVNEALDERSQSVYVEIGVRNGDSFRQARAKRRIAVDPSRTPVMRSLRPGEEFFEKTSDDFFAQDARTVFAGAAIDVALVDGLHEFRQALRDVLNLEPYMAEDGVIVIDDCNPQSEELAAQVHTGAAWNGDVWKVIAVLRQARPDLTVHTVNADEGIGLVTGFSRQAPELAPKIVDEFKQLPYEHLADHRDQVLGLRAPGPLRTIIG